LKVWARKRAQRGTFLKQTVSALLAKAPGLGGRRGSGLMSNAVVGGRDEKSGGDPRPVFGSFTFSSRVGPGNPEGKSAPNSRQGGLALDREPLAPRRNFLPGLRGICRSAPSGVLDGPLKPRFNATGQDRGLSGFCSIFQEVRLRGLPRSQVSGRRRTGRVLGHIERVQGPLVPSDRSLWDVSVMAAGANGTPPPHISWIGGNLPVQRCSPLRRGVHEFASKEQSPYRRQKEVGNRAGQRLESPYGAAFHFRFRGQAGQISEGGFWPGFFGSSGISLPIVWKTWAKWAGT